VVGGGESTIAPAARLQEELLERVVGEFLERVYDPVRVQIRMREPYADDAHPGTPRRFDTGGSILDHDAALGFHLEA
jgi:hypothetical protein